MTQRKHKTSRYSVEARRRRQDQYQAAQKKYAGPWKRRDRRREAFHKMKQRWRIVQMYRGVRAEGEPEAAAAQQTAEHFACSVSTVRNYYRLWKANGRAGLMPAISVRPSRPKTPWEVIQIIIMLRRMLHWGGDRIAAELKSRGIYQISGQGIYNLFKRYRLPTRTYHPVGRRQGSAYRRGEAKAVNDIWHLDFAGPFVTAEGRKCWVLLGIDAYSRVLLTLTLVTSLETEPVCEVLRELFVVHGTPKMIVTDNGRTFTSVWKGGAHRFTDFLDEHQVLHYRIPAYYPEANGKAEAAVKIVKREALAPCFRQTPMWTIGELERILNRFQTYYNCHRLHGGIGWKPPTQRWFSKGDIPPVGLDHVFFITTPELHFEFC